MNTITECDLDNTYFEGITENGVMYIVESVCDWVNEKNAETLEILVTFYNVINVNGIYTRTEHKYNVKKGRKNINKWNEISQKYCKGRLNIVSY